MVVKHTHAKLFLIKITKVVFIIYTHSSINIEHILYFCNLVAMFCNWVVVLISSSLITIKFKHFKINLWNIFISSSIKCLFMFLILFYESPLLTVYILNINYLSVVNTRNIFYRLLLVFSLSVRYIFDKHKFLIFFISLGYQSLLFGYVLFMIQLNFSLYHGFKDISL